MNQILFTQNNRPSSSKADLTKIIRVFCVFILIFGILLITSSGYSFFKETPKPTQNPSSSGDLPPVPIPNPIPDEPEVDTEKPKLQVTVSGNYAKIKATDETEMDYITYKWNDEPETKISGYQEDKTTIQESVEVLKGENKLTILAVDKAGNQTQTIKTYQGVTKPIISVIQEGNELVIKVTDEDGIDYVYYMLNGKEYKLRTPTTQKELEYRQAMDEGENRISIQAYSINGEVTKFEGRANSL